MNFVFRLGAFVIGTVCAGQNVGGIVPLAVGNYRGQILLGNLDGARLGAIAVSLQVRAAGCASKSRQLFSDIGL